MLHEKKKKKTAPNFQNDSRQTYLSKAKMSLIFQHCFVKKVL